MWEIHLPKHLLKRRLPYLNNNPLYLLGEKYILEFFGEINQQVLERCYFDDIILCREAVHQLAFYGAIFNDGLYSYKILQNWNDSLYLWKPEAGDAAFAPPLPADVLRKVNEYGVVSEKDAVGLPLLSFIKLQNEFPFAEAFADSGFSLLSYDELSAKMGTADSLRLREAPPAVPAVTQPAVPEGRGLLGKILDEIELLTQDPGERSIGEVFDSLRQLREKIEDVKRFRDAGGFEETAGRLRLGTRVVAIPSILADRDISVKDFASCRQVPEKLKRLGFNKWGELPFDLDELLRGISGIGARTVEKFTETVDELFEKARQLEAKETSLRFSFGSLVISVPRDRAEEPLAFLAEQRFLLVPVLDVLYSTGIKEIKDLPARLEDLAGSLPTPQIFELFDSLCAVFDSRLMLAARVQAVVAAVLAIMRQQPSKALARVSQILETKYNNLFSAGHNATLKDVGTRLGVSGERVRQILVRFWQSELALHNCSPDSIAADISRLGGLIPRRLLRVDWQALSPYEQFVVGEVFRVFGLTSEGGFLTTLRRRDYDAVISDLEAALRSTGQMPLTQTAIEKTVETFVAERGLHVSCQRALLKIVVDELVTPGPQGFILKRLSKSDKILHVLREYPQGLGIHKDFDGFFARLDQAFPGEFKKSDRYIYASIVNSEQVFLWGWGVYIHRDNVGVAKEDLAAIVSWIDKQFASNIEKLSVNAAFAQFRELAIAKGIPNEHALYSCLKQFYGLHFFMPKSPYLYRKDAGAEKQNSELVEDYIRNRGRNTGFGELQAEFVGRRGWKEYVLNQAITLSRQIIRTNRGEYGLVELYKLVSGKSLEPMAKVLEDCLAAAGQQVNIRSVFLSSRSVCAQLEIENDIALYSLLEKFFGERFFFSQYPHVQAKSSGANVATNNARQLNDYMRDLGEPVSRKRLQGEFVERRCWTVQALENAIRANSRILALRHGDAAEFVHADVIGWDNRKQARLERWLRDRLTKFGGRPVPYGNVEKDLFKPADLPALAAGVPWTIDLFRALLRDAACIRFLGTKRAVFVPVPNRYGIENDVDFLTHLLQNEFGGAAGMVQLRKRLAELDFAYGGRVPRSCKPDGEELPYVFIGNERVMLKEAANEPAQPAARVAGTKRRD